MLMLTRNERKSLKEATEEGRLAFLKDEWGANGLL